METAWNLNINPKVLEVKYDQEDSIFFIQSNTMRRINISSVRDALSGYQKGKCFYTGRNLILKQGLSMNCAVDHFLPHINKIDHGRIGGNINGVWNLVIADEKTNMQKNARVPAEKYLLALYKRNEYYIESKHPLAETIINQTGETAQKRQAFLKRHYELALSLCIHRWNPEKFIY